MGDTPSGLLRITAPSALAVTLLGDLIGRYCQQHPRVRVLLDTRDQIIDLVGEGYDLAFRAQGASLTDSRLVARELARFRWSWSPRRTWRAPTCAVRAT